MFNVDANVRFVMTCSRIQIPFPNNFLFFRVRDDEGDTINTLFYRTPFRAPPRQQTFRRGEVLDEPITIFMFVSCR